MMYFLILKDLDTGKRSIVNEADDFEVAKDIATVWLESFHESMKDSEHLMLCKVLEVDEDSRF